MEKSKEINQGYPPPQLGNTFTQSRWDPPPTQPPFVLPEPEYTPPEYGWCEDTQRNKPQSNTLAAAVFIFASGGMSLAWSIGFRPYMFSLSKSSRQHLEICWFLAIFIGVIPAAILAHKLKKRIFNLVASALVLINGILFISAPNSVAALAIGRYCDGIAFGLTIIPAIMAGSEQSVKRFRGLVLSVESIGITIGLTIQIACSTFWESNWDFEVNQMHGAFAILFGSIALLCTYCFTIESPTFYLRRDQEPQAVECLRKLQVPHTVTTETYALLYENKHLLQEDIARGTSENFMIGLVPLAKLAVLRILVSMSMAVPLCWAHVLASSIVAYDEGMWPLYLFGMMRMTGTCLTIPLLDSFGRRIPTGISLLLAGGLLIGMATTFGSNSGIGLPELDTVIGLMIVYQFVAGIIAPACTTYLGEAFSISVKPYFIMVAIICENIVQIIITCTFESTRDSFAAYGFTLGTLQLVFGVFTFFGLPETKKTTLREALAKFKPALNLNF